MALNLKQDIKNNQNLYNTFLKLLIKANQVENFIQNKEYLSIST